LVIIFFIFFFIFGCTSNSSPKSKVYTPDSVDLFEEKQYLENQIKLIDVEYGEKLKDYYSDKYEKSIKGIVVNKGNKTLTKIRVTIYYLNSEGQRIAERSEYVAYPFINAEDENLVKPNYEKEFEFGIESKAPKNWGGKVELEITKIEFLETL